MVVVESKCSCTQIMVYLLADNTNDYSMKLYVQHEHGAVGIGVYIHEIKSHLVVCPLSLKTLP